MVAVAADCSRIACWPRLPLSCRQYALAWAHLELGNRIMAAHVQYNEAVDRSNLDAITSIFRAPFMAGGHDDDAAIFVVGMPRSGSTLVEQMLASHSQVWVGAQRSHQQQLRRVGACLRASICLG